MGNTPSYSSRRGFGCLCFAKNMKIQHKYDGRAKPGIFVGYPYAQKGYRIYDSETRQMYVSHDVVMKQFFHIMILLLHPSKIPFPSVQSMMMELLTTCLHSLILITLFPVTLLVMNVLVSMTLQILLHHLINLIVSLVFHSFLMSRHPITCLHHRLVILDVFVVRQHISMIIFVIFSLSTDFPLANYSSLSHLTYSHRAFLTNVINNQEPRFYSQVIKSIEWSDAIALEIRALE